MDYAFENYFIAYKEGKGLGVVDDTNTEVLHFEYDVVSRIGDKKLLKAVKMTTNGDETTIFSNTLEEIITVKNAQIAIDADYIEIYNEDEEVYIDNDGNIKQKEEINSRLEFLGKYHKSYKENSEIYYSDKAVTDEHEEVSAND